MKPNMFRLRSRGLCHLALALCALAVASPRVALAEMRTVSSDWLDLRYDTDQMPDTSWQLTMRGGLGAYQLSDGGWTIVYTEPFAIEILPVHPGATPENRALGHVDLLLQFKGPHLVPLDTSTSLRSDIVPGEVRVMTTSVFGKPDDAQLAISYGRDTLRLAADGREIQSSSLAVLPTTPSLFSENRIGELPWVTMPAGAGSWQLSLDQSLVGANYLLPTDDPACDAVACMASERGAAGLSKLTLMMNLQAELVPTTPVPEPASQALLVGGLLAIAAMRRRARGRSAGR